MNNIYIYYARLLRYYAYATNNPSACLIFCMALLSSTFINIFVAEVEHLLLAFGFFLSFPWDSLLFVIVGGPLLYAVILFLLKHFYIKKSYLLEISILRNVSKESKIKRILCGIIMWFIIIFIIWFTVFVGICFPICISNDDVENYFNLFF